MINRVLNTKLMAIDSTIENDNLINKERKLSAYEVEAEIRRSMLQVARKSMSEALSSSKIQKKKKRLTDIPIAKNNIKNVDSIQEDEASTHSELEENQQLLQEKPTKIECDPLQRLHLIGFFKGLLDRISLLMQLPGALKIADSQIDIQHLPEGKKILEAKNKILAAANLIKYTLPHPIAVSKFQIEAKWLKSIFEKALDEVEKNSSFEVINKTVEDNEKRENELLQAIEAIKDLKWKTEVTKYVMKAEAEAHVQNKLEWAKNLTTHKKELTEMRKEQRIAYKFKAEQALATADIARRDREIKLTKAQATNSQLNSNLEREKKVHTAIVDYMGKQNTLLREEVINLTASLENDTQCMIWAIEHINAQIKMKKAQIANIEPKYFKEIEIIAKAKADANKRHEEWYANQGYNELSLKAAFKIQKIWRGYLVRRIWRKALKKLRKKRLAAAKGSKKNQAKKTK
ncbi:uncharacterized protein [Physcomitrium patens]|nr:IQ domain-containing protein D-like [Physcomitrium patens]|eukprot:XP_024359936.1 IQ domain-containing protein D-like [Physcomitrella patens]